MDAAQEHLFKKLSQILSEMVGLYRSLLDIVRREQEALIKAAVDDLAVLNEEKENILAKLKAADISRERAAIELGAKLGLVTFSELKQGEVPRLSQLSQALPSAQAKDLRSIHSTLELLFARVSEINQDNAIYADSALKTLGGALNEIKGTLAGKPVYGQKGKLAVGPEKSGNFISKEA